MQIVVLADAVQKKTLLATQVTGADVLWITDEQLFAQHAGADVFIDLQFAPGESRLALLAGLLPKTVIVNSVAQPLTEIHPSFTRINGWNTFLASPLIEAACLNEEAKPAAEAAFVLFKKKIEWLPDAPGFITARVVSTIINEAFIALGEGVSTKEEINTALKLGTAYPFGPFEWAEKIGLQNVVALLNKLSETEMRYTPSLGMLNEAAGSNWETV